MYRRWLLAALLPLITPAAAAARGPSPITGQFNPAVNSDLVRIADLARARAALEFLPQERRAAAAVSLDAELDVLARRVAASLAI